MTVGIEDETEIDKVMVKGSIVALGNKIGTGRVLEIQMT
jgi:hypothetical protein